MTTSQTLTVGVLCAVAITVGFSMLAPKPVVPKPDTVVIRESAISQAVAETTRLTVTRTRTLRDTVLQRLTDTAFVTRYVLRVDTLLQRCDECAARLERHRVFTDSVINRRDDSIVVLNAALVACKSKRPWYAVAGFAGCAVIVGAIR